VLNSKYSGSVSIAPDYWTPVLNSKKSCSFGIGKLGSSNRFPVLNARAPAGGDAFVGTQQGAARPGLNLYFEIIDYI
jgi:hypothetical protein